MIAYAHFTPTWLKWLLPHATWQIPGQTKTLYLTFDDGPAGSATDWLLKKLSDYRAEATFFLIGQNIERDLPRARAIHLAGHSIGNHTFSHPNCLYLSSEAFKTEIERCDHAIEQVVDSNLPVQRFFRPPYGMITPFQAKQVTKTHQLMMWQYLSGDFDPQWDIQKSKSKWSSIKSGDISVFHDNFKHFDRLKAILPDFLAYFADQGYQFKPLP